METANISKVLRLFNKLSKPEQLEVAANIEKQTFKERRKLLNNMSAVDIADDDIVQEIRTVRYGSEKLGLL